MLGKARTYLFYLSLLLIPALSILGREIQSLVSSNNLIEIAEYIIGAALIATSVLIVTTRQSRKISAPLICVSMIIFVLIPYQLERYEERLHFICFGILGFTAYRSFGIKVAAVLSCSVGLSDEMLQHFLPSRVGDLRDVFMNCFAGVAAVMLAHKVAHD